MLRIFAYALSLTSELFTGHPLPSSLAPFPDAPVLEDHHLQQHVLSSSESVANHEWVQPMGTAPPFEGQRLPQQSRDKWRLLCPDPVDKQHSCSNLVNGDTSTYYLTSLANGSKTIMIDLGAEYPVSGIAVAPRQDRSINDPQDGNVARHFIYARKSSQRWGEPVAYGTWWSDKLEKMSSFEPVTAQWIALAVYSDATNSKQVAISDFNVFVRDQYSVEPPAGVMGKWGPTINTPIVPITAFVDPLTEKVVLISSKRHDNFDQERPDFTMTVVWDPVRRTMTQADVENTRHNMFCPSTTFDADGRMIVAGGATGKIVSIYNGTTNSWTAAARMKYTRGYNAATLNADGRMFVLGGSWGHLALVNPDEFRKDGEIYDPVKDTWTLLRGCKAAPMLTEDREYYRRDNHGMLFAWKDDWIFHAGPSKNMNWYSLNGRGSWTTAGTRNTTSSENITSAMNGQAVMYDSAAGEILVFGGAEDYFGGRPTLAESYKITLGEPKEHVTVEKAGLMNNPRTYAQAVVVPNGDIIVTGGQGGIPIVFNDTNPVFAAEVYSPKTGLWTQLANNSIVRVYHSWTLLLPDGRIASGGSGLCGDRCNVNHFDVQIFTPPYLLDASGAEAKRPKITKIATKIVSPGDTLLIETDSPIVDASLIRYSGTTHTVNNDQRRVALTPVGAGTGKYTLDIPGEGYVVIPGYWMLFVLNKEGVPSVATTVKVLIGHG